MNNTFDFLRDVCAPTGTVRFWKSCELLNKALLKTTLML